MKNTDGPNLSSLPDTYQNRILKAASYAGAALDHPLYRLQAKGTGISAHGLAFLDCLSVPKVVAVDSSRWTGGIGERIHSHLKETVRVLDVRVMVREVRRTKQYWSQAMPAHPG